MMYVKLREVKNYPGKQGKDSGEAWIQTQVIVLWQNPTINRWARSRTSMIRSTAPQLDWGYWINQKLVCINWIIPSKGL